MARIRSVKPEFWSDRRIATKLSRDARLLYIALWNFADEHSRLHGDARYVKGNCMPYDDDLSLTAIDALIDELETAGRVQRYEVDGDPFLFLPHLAKHQRLEPAKVPSRLPEPHQDPDADVSESRADSSAPRPDKSGTIVALQVAGGREQVAGVRGADAAPAALDHRHRQTANALLTEHSKAFKHTPPRRVTQQTGEQIDALLDEGVDPQVIRRALTRLREKPNLGPGVLPNLVMEVQAAAQPGVREERDVRSFNGLLLDSSML